MLVTIFKEYRIRLMWLVIGLIGSLFIAKVIGSYEGLIKSHVILAAYIPLIVYISDAVGTQMESVIIRAIGVEHHFVFRRFILKQAILTLMVAITLFIFSFFTITFIHRSYQIGLVVSLGLLGGVLSSLVTGSVIPYYFWKFHQDPAEASGPIATIIQDTLSVIVFFLVASFLLK